MKQIITTTALFFLFTKIFSQNVGIGTTNPSEKLEVYGGIKIGATTNTAKGTIRWNESKNDFEGYNGTAWVSLTSGKGNWGSTVDYVHESAASDIRLQFNSTSDDLGNYLGSSLALVNNYLIAGAFGDYDANGTVEKAGSVRILKKENGIWKQHEVLRPQGAGSQFGYSVAADGNQFIVGANTTPVGSNPFQGRAFIYGLNSDGTPVIQASITGSTLSGSGNFGSSVDISGNYAIVGAPGHNAIPIINRGIAYIYQKNIMTATWSEQAILHPSDGGEEDGAFGNSVAISGNIAAVGSMFVRNGNLFRVGKVFIYRLQNNVWTYTQTIIPPNPQGYDKFGSSLSLHGDTLMIGSPQWNGYEASKNGKVYMYLNSNNNFDLQAVITASDGKKGDGFGTSIHFNNGLLVVGANTANIGAKETAGKAYIFKLNGDNWEQQAVLIASNGNETDQFGTSVTIGTAGAIVSSIRATYQTYLLHGRLYFFAE